MTEFPDRAAVRISPRFSTSTAYAAAGWSIADQFCPLVYQPQCCCDFRRPDESGERARDVSAHYQRFMFKAAVKNYGTADEDSR